MNLATIKSELLLGIRHAVPVAFGYIPVSIAYAVYASQVGFSPKEIMLLSMFCYSGSGQFLAVSMAENHAALIAIAVGLFLLNFRYFIMSTCVFSRFEKLSNIKRMLFSHFITDETFAIFTTADRKRVNSAYFLGLFITSWLSWCSGSLIGVLASEVLSPDLTLAMGIAIYALFIAIIIPGCKRDHRLGLLVLSVIVINSVLYHLMAESWAVVISTVVCSLIGAAFIKDDRHDLKKDKGSNLDKAKGAYHG